MGARRAAAVAALLALAAVLAEALHAQRFSRRWEKYEYEMQDPVDDPPDALEKTEFAFGRLRYRSRLDGRAYSRWAIDCNKSDRQFLMGLRRLTRIHARSVEEIVDIESDDIYTWPWMFGVSIGDWDLTASHAQRLRQYFLRGGFMMVDDFHGEREWDRFLHGMSMIFPEGVTWVEMQDKDPILQILYDLSERFQIPGANVVHGSGYERGGVVPHWRAVLDSKGRVIVAICFNMDVGDAWEFADDPGYPEKFASLAYRLGINFAVYAMTH
jgi:hypothetical protein